MFGIGKKQSPKPNILDAELLSVLNRNGSIPALPSLIASVKNENSCIDITRCAITFDSSVFLRMAGDGAAADIVDYINTQHNGPIILPGQSIQEFWNNQLNAVDTIAQRLKKKFDEFKREAEKLDNRFSIYSEKILQTIEEFNSEHGHVFEDGVAQKTIRFLEILEAKSIVPFVSRDVFRACSDYRKRTMTPPGFRDSGDGDFYIWVDLLRGLQIARGRAQQFNQVIFVTLDKKDDWSRGGIAHPVLCAEVGALFHASFNILDMKELASLIAVAG